MSNERWPLVNLTQTDWQRIADSLQRNAVKRTYKYRSEQ